MPAEFRNAEEFVREALPKSVRQLWLDSEGPAELTLSEPVGAI